MPDKKDKEDSVHLAQLPEVNDTFIDNELAARWERIINVRGQVTKALEEARAKKEIGHSLDASVIITAQKEIYDILFPYAEDLKSVFIVSNVNLIKDNKPVQSSKDDKESSFEEISILIEPAKGKKCERCWIYDISVGDSSEHPSICSRCLEVVENLEL